MDETKNIAEMHEHGLNLIQIFAIEVNIALNTYIDYWKMFVDTEVIKTKHISSNRWMLPHGEIMKQSIPLHLDKYKLYLILQ